jgi:hypothetical protein
MKRYVKKIKTEVGGCFGDDGESCFFLDPEKTCLHYECNDIIYREVDKDGNTIEKDPFV